MNRTFCGFKEPLTGWNNEPATHDRSVIANLIRLKIGRNRISHLRIAATTNKFYKEIYKYLKQPLLDLGCSVLELNDILPKPIRFKFTPAVHEFANRDIEIAELHGAIQQIERNPGVLAVAVSAFSGTGKTQLVKKYFDTHSNFFKHNVVWINAASIEESFKEFAKTIHVRVEDENGKEKDLDVIINEAHDYVQDDQVLFVFDNFEQPCADEDLQKHLIRYIPNGTTTYSIITSQSEVSDPQFFNIKLKSLGDDSALDFVVDCLGPASKEMEEIVNILGSNAFALRQFVSYVQETRTPVQHYLKLLKLKPEAMSRPQERVCESLNITMDKLVIKDENALSLLQLMLFLDGKEIKRGFFIYGNGRIEDDLLELKNVNNSLRTLETFSLISIANNANSYLEDVITVHALVQETLRFFPRQGQTLDSIFQKLMAFIFHEGGGKSEEEITTSDLKFFKFCHKQLIYIDQSFGTSDLFLKTCAQNVELFVSIFRNQGRLTFAIRLLKNIKESDFIKENLQSLYRVESCIGYCYYHRRDFAYAYKLLGDVKEKQKQLLGKEHPDHLKSWLGFTRCLSFLRWYEEGKIMSKELLKLHLDILGSTHPQTLICKRVVALNISRLGEAKTSLKMYEEVLDEQIKIYGQLHPEVFITQHDLAIRKDQNVEARIDVFKQIFEKKIRLYGRYNPSVASTEWNLAKEFTRASQYVEALKHATLKHANSAYLVFMLEYEEQHPNVFGTRGLIATIKLRQRKQCHVTAV